MAPRRYGASKKGAAVGFVAQMGAMLEAGRASTPPPPPPSGPTRFWLGTHMPGWLERAGVPLFVSRRRLAGRKTQPLAAAPWALDSGGFSELTIHGKWTVSPRQYVGEVCRWLDRPGRLEWAAQMDWMCEPIVREGGWVGAGKNRRRVPGTGLSVRDHQRLTVENYLTLRELCPEVPWVPVLQGWLCEDYFRHLDDFKGAGVDLASLPLVGLGSVCRRQGTALVEELVRCLAARGVRLHCFGLKMQGLARVADVLPSADSLAWSHAARCRKLRLPECRHRAKTCRNCLRWALRWRGQALRLIERAARRPRANDLFILQ